MELKEEKKMHVTFNIHSGRTLQCKCSSLVKQIPAIHIACQDLRFHWEPPEKSSAGRGIKCSILQFSAVILSGTTFSWFQQEPLPSCCWKDRQRLPSFLPLLFGLPVTELPDGGNIFQAIHTTHENYPRSPLYSLPLPLLVVWGLKCCQRPSWFDPLESIKILNCLLLMTIANSTGLNSKNNKLENHK